MNQVTRRLILTNPQRKETVIDLLSHFLSEADLTTKSATTTNQLKIIAP